MRPLLPLLIASYYSLVRLDVQVMAAEGEAPAALALRSRSSPISPLTGAEVQLLARPSHLRVLQLGRIHHVRAVGRCMSAYILI
jgi:hypothetical protein